MLNEFASAGNDPVTLALTYIQKEAKDLIVVLENTFIY
jgi:hypothetical protein